VLDRWFRVFLSLFEARIRPSERREAPHKKEGAARAVRWRGVAA